MFSVSAEIYNAVSVGSRWLFVFIALLLLLFSFSWLHSLRKEHRSRFKNLPGAGTIGELIVISGSRELPPDTWFPVPREGVLGSVRSCDLVIPCPGVRSQHLDFSWQDGTGLLIRPRLGCEVLVDGIPVSRRGVWADTPLIHGSVLQVGSAVLRLQLFSALSHTNRVFAPQSPVPAPDGSPAPFVPQSAPPAQIPPAAVQPWPADPYTSMAQPPVPPFTQPPFPQQSSADQPAPVQQPQPEAPRRRHPDRWKEDWSE